MVSDRAKKYEEHKARAADAQRENSRSGREIGPLPAIKNKSRRSRCLKSLRKFCETYLKTTFPLGWSDAHLEAIAKLEEAVLRGGQFGMAMARGSGKSSLCLAACLWAALGGHRAFTVLIGATEADAEESLAIIAAELDDNDLLYEDFPEVCHPIRCLEGIHQRRLLLNGAPVSMDLKNKEICLPDVKGSKCAGYVIKVAGLTGRVRGMKHKTPDGRTVRPSLVILDDPQTDESANSPAQCETRERIVNGAVLGLAGPRETIAAVMPCTVIAEGDMADRILDRKRNPQWRGQRTAFMTQMAATDSPAHKLWLEYCDIRRKCQREDRSTDEATEFYRANREAMDAGYLASWEWRFNEGELSATQNAWNVICDRGEAAFYAEYQNQPMKRQESADLQLSADLVASRLNRCERGVVAASLSRLTGFIDVQGKALYWLVAAWSDSFSGAVVDYGAWPEQGLSYFTLNQVKRTIQVAFPDAGPEAQIYAALKACTEMLARREWHTESGATVRLERLLIDANWGDSTDTVKLFCRQSPDGGILLPSHGRYVGASAPALNERAVGQGDRIGTHWRIPAPDRARPVRHVVWDTNYWKSFVAGRLRCAMGSLGALTLFGDRPETHRMLCDHLTAEYATKVEARGRTVDEWRLYPGRDNHFWDCLVGSAVAASISGCSLMGAAVPVQKKSGPRVRINMPTASGDRPFFISGR